MRTVDFLVLAGVALIAGGAVAVAPAEVLVGVAALALVLARGRGARFAARVALVLGAGVSVAHVRAARVTEGHERALAAAAERIPRPVRCAGVARVDTSPVRAQGSLRWTAVLRDADCEGTAWSGPVTLYGGPDELARGDDAAVVCDLGPPTRLWNLEDPRPAEARRGAVRSGGVLDARVLVPGRGWPAAVDRARRRVRDRIEATFAPDVAPMTRALVLGESDLAPEDDAAMRASGLSHLLAVSGMHLVVVVGGAVAALRALLLRLEVLAASRDVGRIAAAVGVPLAFAYADFAGGSGATWRAAWMLACAFTARALGRRANAWRAFGWSLVAMAVCDPLAVFDVSFLLSAAAISGLMTAARPAAALAARAPSLLRPVVRSVSATVAASVACAPLLARFVPTVPLGGVVANLLAVPVGESLALPLCLAHALLAPLPGPERGCALVAGLALRLVRAIARFFGALPALAVPVPPPTSWQLVTLGVGAAAIALASTGRRRGPALVTAASLLLLELGARRAAHPTGRLRVTFLDVGQGDAALLDLPDGSAALVDGGGLVGSPIDTGERVIAPALRARRRDALAFVALSHPHPDHFTGLASGLAGARVGALWDTGQGEREGVAGAYAALLAGLRARGVPVLHPRDLCGPRRIGGAVVDVLAPCPDPVPDRGANDNSLVLRVSYGDRAVLLVGDAEREEERDLLRLDPARLRADVLKVGHHGSRTSSSPAFLAVVAPREAILSAGARNRFGHPHPATLVSLAAAGARVWRTELEGAITLETDGGWLRVSTARRGRVDGGGPSF